MFGHHDAEGIGRTSTETFNVDDAVPLGGGMVKTPNTYAKTIMMPDSGLLTNASDDSDRDVALLTGKMSCRLRGLVLKPETDVVAIQSEGREGTDIRTP